MRGQEWVLALLDQRPVLDHSSTPWSGLSSMSCTLAALVGRRKIEKSFDVSEGRE